MLNENNNAGDIKRDEQKSEETNILEEQPNLRFAWIVIHYPCSIIFIFSLIFIGVSAAGYFGFEMAPQSTHTYFIIGEPEVDKMTALLLAQQGISDATDNAAIQTQPYQDGTLIIMFKTRDNSNILNIDYLPFISDITNKISKNNVNEYNKLCFKSESDPNWPECSIQSIWDPLVTWYNDNNGTVTQNELNVWLNDINTDSNKENYWNSFEEGFSNDLESSYYRGFWIFGFPYPDINDSLSSFINRHDRLDEQKEFYNDYIFPIYQDIQLTDHKNNIEVVVYGLDIRNLQIDELVNAGVAFSLFSIITVVCLMWLHLQSLFLAISSLIQILLGFPFAFFVYRWIAQITYFDTMSTLVIFLILGIGADDVFVFIDAWRQSITLVGDDLVDRMSFTYRRASKAMVVTTATTFFAFIATGFSPLLPISAFGYWAACVVLMNYIMVITLFPAILSWWYQHVRKCERLFCCKCCRKDTDLDDPEGELKAEMNEDPVERMLNGEARFVERFCRDKWFKFISKTKWILIILSLAIIGVGAWQAIQISPLSKQEEFFRPEHYMEKMFSWQNEFYEGSANDKTQLRIVWGLESKLDETDAKYWDVNSWGNVQYDPFFDLSPIQAQEHVLYICDDLVNNITEELYDIADHFNCFIHDFREYGESQNLTFPFYFDRDAVIQRQQFLNLFEEWLTQDPSGKGQSYVSNGFIGYIELTKELRFVLIDFKIELNKYDSFETKQTELDKWETRMKEWNNTAIENGAVTVAKGFQASVFSWAWLATDRGFVRSALQGIGIALPLAFLSLLVSTQNLFVSTFAISAIIGIVVCEVALMVLQGWELGISESIAIVMMIGFSVDYVVHLGNSYIECEISGQRDIRTIWALYTMAISVVFGGLTTFGSGFWLIWPEMLFFKKFGFLVMTVVGLSLFFSLVYFMSLLSACGPVNNTGHCPIWKCFEPCCNVCDNSCTKSKYNICGTIERTTSVKKESEIESRRELQKQRSQQIELHLRKSIDDTQYAHINTNDNNNNNTNINDDIKVNTP